jgi:hypothetical protein
LIVGSASAVEGVGFVHRVGVGRRIVVIQVASVIGSVEVVHEASGVGSIEVALASVVGSVVVALVSVVGSVVVALARSSTTREVISECRQCHLHTSVRTVTAWCR